ncbi:luciferin sulfotransferase-like [Bombus pascuorum]|uniref:luciferin sulfotransferase-like n=1 Tax=Bombus pascuorum TaxID=65598 RepID=UPI0021366364|nr:luciferin sulfotransferase-like [Bombus pascuorum]
MTTLQTDDLDQILQDQFTSEFRNGYIKVRGFCLPARYEVFADVIENFEVKDDDIWVCSFPKTGTTWTQEMIWNIANNLDFEGAKVHLSERFPFFEYSILFDYLPYAKLHPEVQLPLSTLDSVEYTKNKASPRFIKTHLPFDLLPRQIRTGEKKPKIIYVARNPKDTCISYFHHCQIIEGYRGNFSDFCRLFLADKLSYTSYWNHVLDFWKKQTTLNMLLLKYEYMIADLPGAIRKSAAFLNRTLTDAQVRVLEEHLKFASMKKNPAVNHEDVVQRNKERKKITVEGSFIRNGKVGEWKERLPDNVIQEFDRLTKERFSPYHLNF